MYIPYVRIYVRRCVWGLMGKENVDYKFMPSYVVHTYVRTCICMYAVYPCIHTCVGMYVRTYVPVCTHTDTYVFGYCTG